MPLAVLHGRIALHAFPAPGEPLTVAFGAVVFGITLTQQCWQKLLKVAVDRQIRLDCRFVGFSRVYIDLNLEGARRERLPVIMDILAHNFFHTHTGWLVTGLVALAFYGVFVLLRRFPNRTAMLCLWATLDYVAYCVTLPEPGHGGRYQPFVLLLFPPLMAIALLDLSRRVVRRMAAPRVGIALQWASVGLIAVLTAATLPRWEAVLRDGTTVIDTTHEKLALWIRDNYPPDTRMAVFDIGAIGYFANIHVVDLGGLVDRNYLPYLISGRVPDYLHERGVEYVILPHTGSETHFGDLLHLLHNPALRLVPSTPWPPIPWCGRTLSPTPATHSRSRRSTGLSPFPRPSRAPRQPRKLRGSPPTRSRSERSTRMRLAAALLHCQQRKHRQPRVEQIAADEACRPLQPVVERRQPIRHCQRADRKDHPTQAAQALRPRQ